MMGRKRGGGSAGGGGSVARPDSRGYFGPFGGRFVPETLMTALSELDRAFGKFAKDSSFQAELRRLLSVYAGRPTPLYFAERMTRDLGGAKIYLKREDLLHTGAHKINNTIGQALLARWMGKRRVTAETGAGQHGVATATACALFGLDCEVFMGEVDVERQALNVFKMELLGTSVVRVGSGSRTLKDAISEAIRDWVTNVETTYYLIGSTVGPHPYPKIVRTFHTVIGRETRRQIRRIEGRDPDVLVACVGGGSNALGLFHPFYGNRKVRFIGVEAAGHGLRSGEHGASLAAGEVGILHGSRSYLLGDEDGQVVPAHSIAAGLDYPGVGPEHSFYKETGRADYRSVTDAEALEGFRYLARIEGIVPALETAHAVAHVMKIAPTMKRSSVLVLNVSGRGDKDIDQIADAVRGSGGADS